MKTSWRCIEDAFRLRLQRKPWSRWTYSPYTYVCRRRLDQDQYIRLGHTSSRRLQHIFKISCQIVFKTSSRHLQDVSQTSFKMSSRLLAKTSTRCLWDVFKTFLRRSPKTVIYGWICLGHTSGNLWSVYKICQGDKSFSNFSSSLYYTF